MKKRILAMLMCMVLMIGIMPVSALAVDVIDSGSCGDGLTWTLDKNYVLTISGEGPMADLFSETTNVSDIAWNKYRSDIKSVVIEEGVTSISDNSFRNCAYVTEVSISSSVSNIGDYAFEGCKALQRFVVDKDNNYYCNDKIGLLYTKDMQLLKCVPYTIEEMVLPKAVLEIAYDAFSDGDFENTIKCTGDAITYYGTTMFGNTIYYPENNPTWTEAIKGAFGSNIWITYIPDEDVVMASGECGDNLTWNLTEDGVLTISGEGAMRNYNYGEVPWYDYSEAITSVVIKKGVTSISAWSFMECNNVKTISIADTVTSIGRHAIYSCDNLSEIYIPASVIWIDYYNFFGCENLKAVWVDENNKNYSSDKHGGFIDDTTNTLIWVSHLFEGVYTVSDGVSCIDYDVFDNCEYITEIIIPESVTEIDCLFQSCYELTGIWVDENNEYYSSDESGALLNKEKTELLIVPRGITGEYVVPDGVVSIMSFAINGFEKLDRLVIPASVEYIDESALVNSVALTEIFVDADNKYFSSDVFGVLYNKDKTELVHVPCKNEGFEYTIPSSVKKIRFYAIGFTDIKNYIFEGDAPVSESSDPFWWREVTVYYPESNPTWTDDVIQSYGGDNVTWIPYSDHIRGDINSDGRVSNSDLVILARYVLDIYESGSENAVAVEKYGDLNNDGRISNSDLVILARINLGMI